MPDIGGSVVVLFKVGFNSDGYWLVITSDGQPFDLVGPFDSEREAVAARDDAMEAGRECGGIDMPPKGH